MPEFVKKRKITIPVLGALVLLMVFALLSVRGQDATLPHPVQGVLDLSGWNPASGRPVLSGPWEFYWKSFYSAGDFQQGQTAAAQLVEVPDTWNSLQTEGTSLPGFGYATYRLRVRGAVPGVPLSLRMDTVSTAYRLYVDGQCLAGNGIPGKDAESAVPGYLPGVVDFTPATEHFDIILQISNFTYARGGLWYEVQMGTHGQIAALDRMVVYKDALLIGSLLIMALYYICYYLALQRDRSSGYFMLLCLIFIIRTSLYGDMMIVRLFPGIPFRLLIFLTYATLYWICITLFLLVNSLYPGEKARRAPGVFCLYGVLATAATAVLPVHLYTRGVTVIEVIGIAMVVYALGIALRAWMKGARGGGLILLAMAAILLAGIHDVLYQANVIRNAFGELASVGIFIFMFTFSFIIASRFSRAFEASRDLSQRLEDSLRKEQASSVELVRTELAFLKAQIKPHFIYNSLSVIAALTLESPAQAKNLLYHLTAYLRGSFNFEHYNGLAPLADELDTVRAYLEIEKARFQEKLRVTYAIDDDIFILLPLLTIQPVVENAVRHGILKKPGGGTVTLRISRCEGDVVVCVEDDGAGMTQEKLAEVRNEAASVRGVGIRNISRRLRLIYGKGLEVESTAGVGTRVTIRIPEEGMTDDESHDRG